MGVVNIRYHTSISNKKELQHEFVLVDMFTVKQLLIAATLQRGQQRPSTTNSTPEQIVDLQLAPQKQLESLHSSRASVRISLTEADNT